MHPTSRCGTFSASVSYALKPRPVTPIIEGHLGYVFDQSIDRKVFESSLPEGTILPPDVDVKGMIRGEGSANYWLTTWFRVGAFIGLDFCSSRARRRHSRSRPSVRRPRWRRFRSTKTRDLASA